EANRVISVFQALLSRTTRAGLCRGARRARFGGLGRSLFRRQPRLSAPGVPGLHGPVLPCLAMQSLHALTVLSQLAPLHGREARWALVECAAAQQLERSARARR